MGERSLSRPTVFMSFCGKKIMTLDVVKHTLSADKLLEHKIRGTQDWTWELLESFDHKRRICIDSHVCLFYLVS